MANYNNIENKEIISISKFKVPKSFWLCGQKINVKIDPDLIDRQDAQGEAHYRKNEILLQDFTKIKRPISHFEQSFFHEFIHHILSIMNEHDLRNNEKFVDIFSGLLHQAFITMEYE